MGKLIRIIYFALLAKIWFNALWGSNEMRFFRPRKAFTSLDIDGLGFTSATKLKIKILKLYFWGFEKF